MSKSVLCHIVWNENHIILLLYDKNEEFEDVFLRTNAEGEIETVVENGNIKF
jgi:hypothetical protein